MNGQQLWRAVRREFKKQYPYGIIHRVENTLERGMSDVVWTAHGKMGWIELKGEGDKETPIQRAFRKKWVNAGCEAVLLVAKGKGFMVTAANWGSDEPYSCETLSEFISSIVIGG